MAKKKKPVLPYASPRAPPTPRALSPNLGWIGVAVLLVVYFGLRMWRHKSALLRHFDSFPGGAFVMGPQGGGTLSRDAVELVLDEFFLDPKPELRGQVGLASAALDAPLTAAEQVLPEGLSCASWRNEKKVQRPVLFGENAKEKYLLAPYSVLGGLGKNLAVLNLALNLCLLSDLALVVSPQFVQLTAGLIDHTLFAEEAETLTSFLRQKRDYKEVKTSKVGISMDELQQATRQVPEQSVLELMPGSFAAYSPDEKIAIDRMARDVALSGPLMRSALLDYGSSNFTRGSLLDKTRLNIVVFLARRPVQDDAALAERIGAVVQRILVITAQLRESTAILQAANVILYDENKAALGSDAFQRIRAMLEAAQSKASPLSIQTVQYESNEAVTFHDMTRADVLVLSPRSSVAYFAATLNSGVKVLYGHRGASDLSSLSASLTSVAMYRNGSFDAQIFSRLFREALACPVSSLGRKLA
ncbi:hypothetical protein FVE85_5120 [Porphyridium purpureum]|uniref:Uncharacterized protein n=1 Tax=Porphyridium purpureum TaxID=35688 RepID=A0A5J4Z2K6_PORPP|nr:hypothetical protein FVE85_5120 [Porphyridium purpureum]|eukprot:POR5569..scf295_1